MLSSINNILSYLVNNKYSSIIFSAGELPLLLAHDSLYIEAVSLFDFENLSKYPLDNSYLDDVMPINIENINELEKYFLLEENYSLTNVSDKNFLVSKVGKSIVFKYLPVVDKDIFLSLPDGFLAESILKSRIQIFVSRNHYLSSLFAYSFSVDILKNRRFLLLLLETNKSFHIENSKSKIQTIYKPDLDLDVIFNITNSISSDLLLIPSFTADINFLKNIIFRQNKKIILGLDNYYLPKLEELQKNKEISIVDLDQVLYNNRPVIFNKSNNSKIHVDNLLKALKDN